MGAIQHPVLPQQQQHTFARLDDVNESAHAIYVRGMGSWVGERIRRA